MIMIANMKMIGMFLQFLNFDALQFGRKTNKNKQFFVTLSFDEKIQGKKFASFTLSFHEKFNEKKVCEFFIDLR